MSAAAALRKRKELAGIGQNWLGLAPAGRELACSGSNWREVAELGWGGAGPESQFSLKDQWVVRISAERGRLRVQICMAAGRTALPRRIELSATAGAGVRGDKCSDRRDVRGRRAEEPVADKNVRERKRPDLAAGRSGHFWPRVGPDVEAARFVRPDLLPLQGERVPPARAEEPGRVRGPLDGDLPERAPLIRRCRATFSPKEKERNERTGMSSTGSGQIWPPVEAAIFGRGPVRPCGGQNCPVDKCSDARAVRPRAGDRPPPNPAPMLRTGEGSRPPPMRTELSAAPPGRDSRRRAKERFPNR